MFSSYIENIIVYFSRVPLPPCHFRTARLSKSLPNPFNTLFNSTKKGKSIKCVFIIFGRWFWLLRDSLEKYHRLHATACPAVTRTEESSSTTAVILRQNLKSRVSNDSVSFSPNFLSRTMRFITKKIQLIQASEVFWNLARI